MECDGWEFEEGEDAVGGRGDVGALTSVLGIRDYMVSLPPVFDQPLPSLFLEALLTMARHQPSTHAPHCTSFLPWFLHVPASPAGLLPPFSSMYGITSHLHPCPLLVPLVIPPPYPPLRRTNTMIDHVPVSGMNLMFQSIQYYIHLFYYQVPTLLRCIKEHRRQP